MTKDEQIQFADNLLKLSPWERGQFLRFLIRLRNDDPKARRLAELADRGQITRRQLLEAM
jgi:hypothetical protein